MRCITKPRLALTALAASIAACLFAVRPPLRAEPLTAPAAGGFDAQEEEEPAAPRVYLNAPVSAQAARVWLKLQQPVSMPFAQETPLEDVIKYIKSSTQSDDLPQGIPIYVDPAGLQEAEQTTQSPVTLELEGFPLATTLDLLLKQLDLKYHVRPDGLVVITYSQSGDVMATDPTVLILDEVKALRREVSELRAQIAATHGGASGGMAGGNPQLKFQLRPSGAQPSGGADASP
jgi:hypothetical protein